MPRLTPDQVEHARRWHRDGKSYWAIARLLRVTNKTVQRAIDPGFRQKYNLTKTTKAIKRGLGKREPIPDAVMIDREARYAAPQTLGGMLLGDPPPGWSALDKREGRVCR